jgi:hypothetical protein
MMALISDLYSGDFLVAAQLPTGRRLAAVIVTAEPESVGQGANESIRIVLQLRSNSGQFWPKKVVCNKTNATLLAAVFGDNTIGWINRPIEVWQELVQYQGRLVPGIRVAAATAPPPSASPGPPPAGAASPGPARTLDELLPGSPPPLVAPRPASTVLPDDSIPF